MEEYTDKCKAYHHNYYVENKEKLNHIRLASYHRKKNGIPIDKLDIYLKSRSLYNSIMKNKNDLDLDFIAFLLKKEDV
tara:strand:+ start:146 stop:379 length:234 start_codon:yes stop_codon:yes gene_type:complete